MKDPIIVVNYKVYESAIGKNAVELSKTLDDVSKQENANVAICVCATDIKPVSDSISLPVFGEHVDGASFGSHTGKILARALHDEGAVGSLINHSEDRFSFDDIKLAVEELKKENMISIVCAKTPDEAKEIATLKPDYIAIEPPELIGGDISVTTADPKVVADTVWLVHEVDNDIKVLCGAGVKTGVDVKKSLELGCVGVLLASGITKVSDPAAALKDMCDGLK